MSSIVETTSHIPVPAARADGRSSYPFWIFLIAFAAIVGCALLASAYPDPAGLDAASFVGP